MELHSLKPAAGAVKSRKRIARGTGSGHGGTSTRGHKGAKSRSGYKSKRAFEGGQMPLQMRLPKRGFKSPNRTEYVALNLERLQAISEKYSVNTINMDTLTDLGIVRKTDLIKILGTGELTAKLEITAHACSESAKSAVEAQGGTITIV
ncbi:MAG: 50S ribosomal protein L15 [Saprospiraceae bacterium]